jgi:hypothetical protein
MNTADLNRVQDDLNVMRAALGGEFPYDRRHVGQSLVVAGAGVIIGLTAIPEWRPLMRSVLVAYFMALMVLWYWQFRQIESEQATRPRAWSWTRRETRGSLLAIGLLVPYVLMMRLLVDQRGEWSFLAWRDYVVGPTLFFVGVAVSSVSIATRERLSWLGWGIAAVLGGLIIPWCQTYTQTSLILSSMITFGGLASAVILHRQIREWEITHVAN